MITIQKVTSNIQSVPRQSPDIHAELCSRTLTPSVIPNYNYVITVSDWNCLEYVCVFIYCNHQVHRGFLITLYFYEGTSTPIAALDRPWGFQEVEDPRFQDSRHIRVVSLSALRTDRLYPHSLPGNIPGAHFSERLSQSWGYSVVGMIMSMKISIEIIWNRTRNLPTCNAVLQPLRAPYFYETLANSNETDRRGTRGS
jgi:hypothetical protein